MENAVEALKIAFAVMMFVVALSLSISSLSQASSTVDAIINLNDRETEYTYVIPTNSNRIVGVETVVPSMYKAYQEKFDIYFYKNSDGTIEEFPIYQKIDASGNIIDVNYIDGSEVFANQEQIVLHLDKILREGDLYEEGLYAKLKGKKFEEKLGEYYITESDSTPDAMKIKKRVITYTIID